MVERDGVILASIVGSSGLLNGLVDSGGFITPEFLESLAGMDIKTIALVIGILYFTRKKKENPEEGFVCPHAEKTKGGTE